jgi:glutamine synthetase
MGIIESFVLLIGRWFGYVGACMFAPDATCRPFLAFVALAAAACAALTLVLMAYRAAQQRDSATAEPQGSRMEPVMPQRVQRAASEPRITARPAVRTRLRVAA